MESPPELRQIPRQPNHHISKCGRIFWLDPQTGVLSEKTGGRRIRNGYVKVRFAVEKKGRHVKKVEYPLHHLILEAWVGPCPPGEEGMHEDDDPMHNELANLGWGTRSENMKTRAQRGRGKRGPNRPWEEKLRIAADYPSLSYRLLGEKHGIHIATAWKIVQEVRGQSGSEKSPGAANSGGQ